METRINKFDLICADTDSITLCKQDRAPFDSEEIDKLLKELNSLYPEEINWEFECNYDKVIILKAKNYVLFHPKEKQPLTIKGSSLKSPGLEKALREFINDIIWTILKEEYKYKEIYEKYVDEILNITDISRWAARKTISEKTLTSTRTNEKKIKEAFEDSDYVEGDRIWVYFTNEKKLKLLENFNNDYDKITLLKKLYNASKRFESILPIKEYFINYSLKKNIKLLGEKI